jgi:hypothetical protein
MAGPEDPPVNPATKDAAVSKTDLTRRTSTGFFDGIRQGDETSAMLLH